MIVSLDTNILVDLWSKTPQGQSNVVLLSALRASGTTFVVCGAVYTELHAYPAMTRPVLDAALAALGVAVNPVMDLGTWGDVGQAYAVIAARQKTSGHPLPRRPLADHLIGAHAQHRADALLTLNVRDFGDFPALMVIQA